MIIKKLAVPFINDKLLQQVEYCYIATSGISEEGFDFVRSRIPTKTKIDMVTGLDGLTSPNVLQRIWRNYQGRFTLNIYTRNTFHANVYIFDLPYRKAVAFVGSGSFTLGGIKDHEEIFYKVIDAKEIESLKSWFTGYFEFSEPLNENLIDEYALLYPSMKQREIEARQEKEELFEVTTAGFSWDAVKFKNQFFKKEDYLTLGNKKAQVDSPEIRVERESLKNKLCQLHQLIKAHLNNFKLFESNDKTTIVSSLDPNQHKNFKLRSMGVSYGRSEKEVSNYSQAKPHDFITMQFNIKPTAFEISLVPGKCHEGGIDREYFKMKMNDVEYRNQFFKLINGLGKDFWIEIAGERRSISIFQNEEQLWEYTKVDEWMYYDFVIGKSFSPGATEINNENIALTITREFDKLIPLYDHMKEAPIKSK